MSDNEKILTWLGYAAMPAILRSGLSVMKLGEDTGGMLLQDDMVLRNVRDRIFSKRLTFKVNLIRIWQERAKVNCCFEDGLLMFYRPGDYAEAARFMWEDSK